MAPELGKAVLDALIKRIAFYSRMYLDNPKAPANPLSSLKGLLRHQYDQSEEEIQGYLVTLEILRSAGHFDKVNEEFVRKHFFKV